MTTLVVAGRGEAVEAKRSRFDAPALASIRYADPASWVTAGAIADAIEASADPAAVREAHDRVGVVVTSAEGPVEAMAAMHEAAQSRSSSPIRFPASNAGSLAGIPSIAFGFRGPTLMLTLPPDRGAAAAIVLADQWIRRGVAAFVVVAACSRRDGKPVARCLLLGGGAGSAFDPERDAAWLSALPEGPESR
jgi:3-oxoacyl-(acyl-carrier-protein) synthase